MEAPPTSIEQLDDACAHLEARITSLDAAGMASKWLRQQKRQFDAIVQRRDKDASMRWLREYKTHLEGWIATVIGERTQHAADVQAVRENEAARHASLVAQAHAAIDPAIVLSEAVARQALASAQQSRDRAQRALIDHEARVPAADLRSAWQRERRDLMLAIEDVAGSVADAAGKHADTVRALRDARQKAWAELATLVTEQCAGQMAAAQAALDAATAAYQAVHAACGDTLRDLNTARLLDC